MTTTCSPRRILAAFFALACLCASPFARGAPDQNPGARWAQDSHYEFCAKKFQFPKVFTPEATGGRYPKVHELELDQKRALVNCANINQVPDFTSWVADVLAEDIKAGRVPPPFIPDPAKKVDPKPAAKPKPQPLDTQSSSRHGGGSSFSLVALVFIVSIVLIIVGHHIKTGGSLGDFLPGPKFLLVVGCGFLVFAFLGALFGRFDEMDGLYPAFAAMFGILILVIAAIWIVIRERRSED